MDAVFWPAVHPLILRTIYLEQTLWAVYPNVQIVIYSLHSLVHNICLSGAPLHRHANTTSIHHLMYTMVRLLRHNIHRLLYSSGGGSTNSSTGGGGGGSGQEFFKGGGGVRVQVRGNFHWIRRRSYSANVAAVRFNSINTWHLRSPQLSNMRPDGVGREDQ